MISDVSDDLCHPGSLNVKRRSVEAKKRLIHRLFERIEAEIRVAPIDVEIRLFEAPASNWGFRGFTGDEAKLSCEVSE